MLTSNKHGGDDVYHSEKYAVVNAAAPTHNWDLSVKMRNMNSCDNSWQEFIFLISISFQTSPQRSNHNIWPSGL